MATQPVESGRYIDDSRFECVNGGLLERPMPGKEHAGLQERVRELLRPFAAELGGTVLSEWSISDGKGNWLTPDVTFSYPEVKTTRRGHLVVPAYLVVEIRSVDQPIKDLFGKREGYRAWAVPDYWLIDPLESACYECLPNLLLCAEKLTTDRIEIAVSQFFHSPNSGVDSE